MKSVKFVRLCQRMIDRAKKNYWKLKKFPLKGGVLELSDKLEIPPVMVVRALLERKGFSKNDINAALNGEVSLDDDLERMIEIANENDPVFSPKGIEYGKWRGEEGERLLALWLDDLEKEYERDLGRGLPDFLLKKKMKVIDEVYKWIESKASFGDESTRRSDESQFSRFDEYGRGVVVYWFGVQGKSKREVLTYIDFLKIFPEDIEARLRKFLNYVPPEFKHLVSD